MTQSVVNLSSNWVLAASGAVKATFQFEDHPGEWTVTNSSEPDGIVGGIGVGAGVSATITLSVGDYLHLRGRGGATLVVVDPETSGASGLDAAAIQSAMLSMATAFINSQARFISAHAFA